MKLSELAAAAGLAAPDRDIEITAAAPLDLAQTSEISFLANPTYLDQLKATTAGAVLVAGKHEKHVPAETVALVCDDPYAAFAVVMQQLYPAAAAEPGIAPDASIASDVVVPDDCYIGPGARIGAGVQLGSGCAIGANSVVGTGVRLGKHCLLHANVTVYHGCVIGDRCILHSGVVLGADGFGFAPSPNGLLKIPQIGRAVLGNDVELGAGTTVDRGALGDTVIGDGVKLDNQIQVGHNVRIGAHTVMAAQTAIAGSVQIGARCMIGGHASIAGHIRIGDDCMIAGRTGVMRDLPDKSKVGGLPAMPQKQWLRYLSVKAELPDMVRDWRKRNDDAPTY